MSFYLKRVIIERLLDALDIYSSEDQTNLYTSTKMGGYFNITDR